MSKSTAKSPLLLFLAALIWGVAFVAQSVGMDYVGPWTFNACRFLLGGLVLLPFLYAGIMSCGVAYTLQILGQRDMDPTIASLILSLESVISMLAGWLLLGQALSGRELLGCVIVFAAIILAQLPDKKKTAQAV